MVHELKVWKPYFKDIKEGRKGFELRLNDRDYKVGDELILNEFDVDEDMFTGDHIHAEVTYILDNQNPFIDLGNYVIMSLKTDIES